MKSYVNRIFYDYKRKIKMLKTCNVKSSIFENEKSLKNNQLIYLKIYEMIYSKKFKFQTHMSFKKKILK